MDGAFTRVAIFILLIVQLLKIVDRALGKDETTHTF